MAASLVAEAATAWLAEAGSLALARRALVLLLVELVLVAALVAARVTALALVSEPVAVAAWVAVGFSWLSACWSAWAGLATRATPSKAEHRSRDESRGRRPK